VEAITRTQGADWRGDSAIVGNFFYQGRHDVAVVGRAGPKAVTIAVATEPQPGVARVVTLTLADLCTPEKASIRAGSLPAYHDDEKLFCPDDSELCRKMRDDGHVVRSARAHSGNSIYVDDPGCEETVVYYDGEQLVYTSP
jgi:hypothetical protein